jgi:undecaprenyl-diphosphatase
MGRKTRDISSGERTGCGRTIGWRRRWRWCPGVSRSGITITAGLFRNINRQRRRAFPSCFPRPAIAGAAAKASLGHAQSTPLHAVMETTGFVVGVGSALYRLIVIAWFLRFLRRSSLWFFVYYRIIFGIIVLALAFIRRPA